MNSLLLIGATLASLLGPSTREEQPLCGIHAVYTAAVLLDAKPSMKALLREEFVGSERGSSLAELESAAASVGLTAVSLRNLSPADLYSLSCPTVLHVKYDLAAKRYNHFVLLGGFDEGDQARIYDGTYGMARWTPAQLASRWDGNALLLSTAPIDTRRLTWSAWRRYAYWACSIGLVVCLANALQRWRGQLGSRVPTAVANQAALLCALAVCGAWAHHSGEAGGFLTDDGAGAVRATAAANASSFLPRIDGAAALAAHRRGATFVDARAADQFARGHIPGAVNLPAYTREPEAVRLASRLPRGRRIVVYCGDPTCPMSLDTAQRIVQAGHDDVVIFTGGWKEWRALTDATGLPKPEPSR